MIIYTLNNNMSKHIKDSDFYEIYIKTDLKRSEVDCE